VSTGKVQKRFVTPSPPTSSLEWSMKPETMKNELTSEQHSVGFAAFLRSGEFTWDTWRPDSHRTYLSHKHVVFRSDGSVILTPPLRQKQTHSAQGSKSILLNPHVLQSAPLQHSVVYSIAIRHPPRIHCSTAAPTFFQTVLHFHDSQPPPQCSGHSLHKGAAVTADRTGISRHDIQLLGRWKSNAVDIYIDERQKLEYIHKILRLNAHLHSSPPLSLSLISGPAAPAFPLGDLLFVSPSSFSPSRPLRVTVVWPVGTCREMSLIE
jgi:hypothetical protein